MPCVRGDAEQPHAAGLYHGLHCAEILHREVHLSAGQRHHFRAAAFEADMRGLDAGCRLEPFSAHVQRGARSRGAVVQAGGFLRHVDELA